MPLSVRATLTSPKALASMFAVGVGLGLLLEGVLRFFAGYRQMPLVFTGVAAAVLVSYWYWLNRQDWIK